MKKRVFLLASLSLSLTASAFAAPGPVNGCPQLTNSAASQALDRHVEAGNRHAAFCLATSLHSLDGGELEDALIALGRYGDRRPAELLMLAHQGTLSRHSLADIVAMLPLSLSDDFHAQATAMKARRDSFTKVAQPALTAELELALRSINSAPADIRALPR